ncbi:MAG: hypothetical protein NTV79_11095 [Candidatus Aureabacteria bacterium]|nr:hypothetical protein [Candidatus Auribacterota bacterium]
MTAPATSIRSDPRRPSPARRMLAAAWERFLARTRLDLLTAKESALSRSASSRRESPGPESFLLAEPGR